MSLNVIESSWSLMEAGGRSTDLLTFKSVGRRGGGAVPHKAVQILDATNLCSFPL